MGPTAFTNYVTSIQVKIGTLLNMVTCLEERVASYEKKVVEAEAEGNPNVQKWMDDLEQTRSELTRIRANIDRLKAFFVEIMKNWSKPRDRVIGYIDWAPSIGAAVPPCRYTTDLCVIKLDKKKFRHFLGNVLSLGACAVSSRCRL